MDNLDDQYVKIGELRNVPLQAADADGDTVTFSLQGAPPYAQIIGGDPGSRRATLRIAPQQGDTAISTNVRVVINDGRGETFTTLPFGIIISNSPNNERVNNPPVAVVAPRPAAVQATGPTGAEVTLNATGSSDPDGDILTYTWYDGDAVIASGSPATVALAAGTHSIKLVASDGKGGSATTDPVSIEVIPRPLTLNSVSPRMLQLNTTATLTVTGTGFFPDSVLRFGKEGITVTSYTTVAEDTIVAEIAISPTAMQGARDVYVINPNGQYVRLRSALIVTR
jgi:hypothetical protein